MAKTKRSVRGQDRANGYSGENSLTRILNILKEAGLPLPREKGNLLFLLKELRSRYKFK